MLRILMTRRWVVLTLVFFALVPVMYFLGVWQFHRYQQTNSSNRLVSANLDATPVPMDEISHPGGTVPNTLMYRHVTASGTFDTADQFVVRNRTDSSGDIEGYFLVTPLVMADGDVVLVNRGWVSPNSVNAAAYPPVPRTPTGTVTVFGRLRPDETTALTGIHTVVGLPPHQFMMINSGQQAKLMHRPVVAGYMELVSSVPAMSAADSAQVVPGPNADAQSTDDMAVVGKGVHLPYAIQWWLFALMVPVGWFFLLRRDVRDQQAKAASVDEPVPVRTVAEYMAERRAAQEAAAAAAEQQDAEESEGSERSEGQTQADTGAPTASVGGGRE
ncbi:SURF1 family protein [Streptacidiphilus sp. PB12-B1b]|uniref:SURF1 family cytochrome oxidase biogenesis protein n=1 Tax=Streptacidiphilus sp. PB12-B1b TaxID=2705012 RepID=UPI0015F9C39C|nr:SURF1 family protein [Streptacidiphilus sp. PB12-B1b]QMU78518.1 SURF1 family protein [Streptacidiphilus sp. PB12-B1b]